MKKICHKLTKNTPGPSHPQIHTSTTTHTGRTQIGSKSWPAAESTPNIDPQYTQVHTEISQRPTPAEPPPQQDRKRIQNKIRGNEPEQGSSHPENTTGHTAAAPKIRPHRHSSDGADAGGHNQAKRTHHLPFLALHCCYLLSRLLLHHGHQACALSFLALCSPLLARRWRRQPLFLPSHAAAST